MGQYYKVVNLDKKEFLHPHQLGDGLKLMEFGASGEGTMLALAILLAQGNGMGGGDFNPSSDPKNLVGSWAGDRIVIIGDYCNDGPFGNLYSKLEGYYKNISLEVRDLLSTDESIQPRKRWD